MLREKVIGGQVAARSGLRGLHACVGDDIGIAGITTAERAHQGHLAVEYARRQIGSQPALVQQLALGIKHRQVSGQAGLVALRDQVVSRLGRSLRGRLFMLLAGQRLQAAELVHHVTSPMLDRPTKAFRLMLG